MNNQDKNKADILLSLSKIGWDNFERRRAHQWKFNISIWTAFSAFIAIVVTRGPVAMPCECLYICLSIAICLAVTLAHGYWLRSVRARDRLDKDIAIFFEGRIMKLLQVEYPSDIKDLKRDVKDRDYWSPVACTVITVTLALAAVLVLFLKPM